MNPLETMCTEKPMYPFQAREPSMEAPVRSIYTNTESPSKTSDKRTEFRPDLQDEWSHHPLQGEEYPGMAAGVEDWAFQSVDLAFFDNLMGSTEPDGTSWQ
jgi:hypothetical protein